MSKAHPTRVEKNFPLPIPTGDVYRVRIYGLIEGQMTCSVFHYMDDLGPPGFGDIDGQGEILDGINAAGGLKDKYTAAMSADWQWSKISIDCPTTPSLATQTLNVSGTGSNHPDHAPTFTAVMLQKKTPVKGKCGRGHVSLPGVPVQSILASQVTDLIPYTDLVPVIMAKIIGTTSSYTPGLFSRGIKTAKKDGFSPYSQVTVRKLLTTVRRRVIGRGK